MQYNTQVNFTEVRCLAPANFNTVFLGLESAKGIYLKNLSVRKKVGKCLVNSLITIHRKWETQEMQKDLLHSAYTGNKLIRLLKPARKELTIFKTNIQVVVSILIVPDVGVNMQVASCNFVTKSLSLVK